MGIFYEVATECNLQCIFCSSLPGPQKKVPVEQRVRIIHMLRSLDNVTLTGGEPSLLKNIVEIAAGARGKGRLSICTNGTAFSALQLARLKQLGVIIKLSLISITNSANIAGKDVCYKTILEKFRKAKVTPAVHTPLIRSNLAELEDIAGMILSYDVSDWRIFLPFPFTGMPAAEQLSPLEAVTAVQKLKKSIPPGKIKIDLNLNTGCKGNFKETPPYVRLNGEVHACARLNAPVIFDSVLDVSISDLKKVISSPCPFLSGCPYVE
jgi:MoaA/NifB/PqqE/SkfB family radical SAM enzyme